MLGTVLFWMLVLGGVGAFVVQMATRSRLLALAPGTLPLNDAAPRIRRVLAEVVFQTKVIRAKPWVGTAHLFVFWGFVAFSVFTLAETLRGLALIDITHTRFFDAYRWLLVPFAIAVLAGMALLLIRRVVIRPPALGATLSTESMLISAFIIVLMVTFLLDLRLEEGLAAEVNWWTHMVAIYAFLALIPNSKHLHLVLSPATVALKAPVLGTVPALDFEREEVGMETVADLPKKAVLDAFTCVECGRCMENCPATATGKLLNPKALVLQNETALLAGAREARLVDVYDPGVLWQCTTCGACEDVCPVGIEHTPVIIGARRGEVSNGHAPDYLAPVYNDLERRGNIWGLLSDQRQKFLEANGLEIFDPARHEYLVWLGCAGSFEADFQKSMRSLFAILEAHGKRFGVLGKERCTGDVAKRTGNEYLFQELATQNVEDLTAAGAITVVTSCPHCLKTIGHDYAAFGFTGTVVHSSVLVERLTREEPAMPAEGNETVTFHDPCYLGRYAGQHEEPRALLTRLGATISEPERTRDNPFCCGAGGGLMFEEHEAGTRISQERFTQLQATGASTVVMGCPFCAVMLKGARASTPDAAVEMVDLMTWTEGRLRKAGRIPSSDEAPAT
jgi:Fe-S oxidoreductase